MTTKLLVILSTSYYDLPLTVHTLKLYPRCMATKMLEKQGKKGMAAENM